MKAQIPRLFCIMCGAFIAVMLCGFYIQTNILIAASAACAFISAVFAVFAILRKNIFGIPSSACLLIALSVLLALVISAYHYSRIDGFNEYVGEEHRIKATVTKIENETFYSSAYEIRVSEIDGTEVSFSALLENEFPCGFAVSDVFEATVAFRQTDDNVFGFDKNQYLLSHGIILSADGIEGSFDYIGEGEFSFSKWFDKINRFISQRLKLLLGEEAGNLVSAMFLGNRDDIGSSLKRDFRRLGISHILALSGLHISIIIGGSERLLKLLKMRKAYRYALLAVLALLFLGVVGFPLSAVRSVLMLLIMFGAYYVSRENDPLTALLLSVSLIMAISPESAIDIGLILSFSATLAIILFAKHASSLAKRIFTGKQKIIGVIRRIFEGVLITLAVMLFTLPFMWMSFGEISLVTPISNIVFVPLASMILWLAPAVLLFGNIPVIGGITVWLCRLVSDATITLAGKAAGLRNITVSLGYEFTAYAVACGVISFIVCLFIVKKNRILQVIIPILTVIAVFVPFYIGYTVSENNTVRVVYMTQKKNDGFAIKSNGKTLVCDISDGSYTMTRFGSYISESKFNSEDIDVYMITHYHNRHINTFSKISSSAYVRMLLLPEPQSEKEMSIAVSLSALAEEQSCEVAFYASNDTANIGFGDAEITIFPKAYLSRSTHPVLAMQISCDGRELTYIGSSFAEYSGSSSVLNPDVLSETDVMIFGIHGPIIKKPLSGFISDFRSSLAVAASIDVCENYVHGADVVLYGTDDKDHIEITITDGRIASAVRGK